MQTAVAFALLAGLACAQAADITVVWEKPSSGSITPLTITTNDTVVRWGGPLHGGFELQPQGRVFLQPGVTATYLEDTWSAGRLPVTCSTHVQRLRPPPAAPPLTGPSHTPHRTSR